jgi:hypothetical protein
MGASLAYAQSGPSNPEAWPPTIDKTKTVHYVVTDPGLEPPSDTWLADELQILTGGDQITQDFCIRGHNCKKTIGSYLNVLDKSHTAWAEKETIDILVQVYGNEAVLGGDGQPRNFTFLTGALPDLNFPNGGQIPVEGKNKQWNWVLFRIPNATSPAGGRFVGGAPAPGGVNGGTIRFEGVGNLIVRVIAFGEEGAFGAPEDFAQFSPAPPPCDVAEPPTNLASIDINAGTTNHLQVLNDGDQKVTFANGVGPAGDKRKAVVPVGTYLNFGITDNYLGKPCHDPRAVKVCVDFYDDPAFAGAGVRFGPEAYALDEGGCVGTYPTEQRMELTGTGAWIRRSWTVPAVNLKGVNAGTLTAGPRLLSENGQVAVSRFELAVLRVGDHPLANQDPLAACVQDANVCKGVYGDYVELDLGKDVKDGLDLGGNGGDQEYIVEEAGPASDRRKAVRSLQDEGSAPRDSYLNFQITDEKLGPTSQDPARLAICATYYDDPALAGKAFRPDVYSTERGGQAQYAFPPASDYNVVLEGTDTWRTAYWEITDMKFAGVNQGPQAAARFTANDKIFITRLRYAVIRPCGPTAGVNLLKDCKPVTEVSLGFERSGNNLKLSWPAEVTGIVVQSTPTLANPQWSAVNAAVETAGNQSFVTLPIGSATQFFRLMR